MWPFKTKKKRRKLPSPTYIAHKEIARAMIFERLSYFAPLCGVTYKRVAIRDTRRCWGSCSSLGNLNFSYKLLFIPQCLADYVIVHELCHLKELNHSQKFWDEVEKIMPDYQTHVKGLRALEKATRTNIRALQQAKNNHACQHCSEIFTVSGCIETVL